MRPKGEKSDVEKRHVFFIIFFMVRAWFLEGFLTIFAPPTSAEVKKNILPKTFRNTAHGDKIKGRRFLNYSKNWGKTEKIQTFLGPCFWRRFGCILRGFWESKNCCFLHFFTFFLVVEFETRFGRRKIPPKSRKKQTFPLLGGGFAVTPPPGKGFRDGFKNFRGWHFENGQIELRNW